LHIDLFSQTSQIVPAKSATLLARPPSRLQLATLQEDPGLEAKLAFLCAALIPRFSGEQGSSIGEPVQGIETHMAWVLLGQHRVFKLKKPVRYPFLDFSTPQAREADLREELRLNRRLAPKVYLGLWALQSHQGRLHLLPEDQLPAPGHTVDWVIEMRRLPADRMLDRVIATGQPTPSDVDGLLDLLVNFYHRAERVRLCADDYLQRQHQALAESRRVLGLPRFGLAGIGALCYRFEQALDQHADWLRTRVQEGRIIDGHGDLRPEHICLINPPVVIDALEFDASLREVDIFDELSYLSLECAVQGAPGLGSTLLSRSAQLLDDHPPLGLVKLYTVQRALLRARLSAAHLLEAETRTPGKWLPQAAQYLRHACAALDDLAEQADRPL
jgi:aminoglycoside phosphotransferase family enzyme